MLKRAASLGALVLLTVGCGQTAPTPVDSSDPIEVADEGERATTPPPSESPSPTPTPAPTKGADGSAAPSVGPPPPPEAGALGACTTHDDCLLIRGLCGQWHPVDRAHEAEETARIQERAKGVRCAKRPISPAFPICRGGRCSSTRPQWPELRSCSSDEDCVALPGTCSEWDAVAKAHRADAEARYAKINAEVPCATKAPGPPPTPVCRTSHCVPR